MTKPNQMLFHLNKFVVIETLGIFVTQTQANKTDTSLSLRHTHKLSDSRFFFVFNYERNPVFKLHSVSELLFNSSLHLTCARRRLPTALRSMQFRARKLKSLKKYSTFFYVFGFVALVALSLHAFEQIERLCCDCAVVRMYVLAI